MTRPRPCGPESQTTRPACGHVSSCLATARKSSIVFGQRDVSSHSACASAAGPGTSVETVIVLPIELGADRLDRPADPLQPRGDLRLQCVPVRAPGIGDLVV